MTYYTKRHLVMDLFYGKKKREKGDWFEVENGLPNISAESNGDKFKVRLKDGTETFAYFYPDQCWMGASKPLTETYWWHCSSKEPLNNVTHWKDLDGSVDISKISLRDRYQPTRRI